MIHYGRFGAADFDRFLHHVIMLTAKGRDDSLQSCHRVTYLSNKKMTVDEALKEDKLGYTKSDLQYDLGLGLIYLVPPDELPQRGSKGRDRTSKRRKVEENLAAAETQKHVNPTTSQVVSKVPAVRPCRHR